MSSINIALCFFCTTTCALILIICTFTSFMCVLIAARGMMTPTWRTSKQIQSGCGTAAFSTLISLRLLLAVFVASTAAPAVVLMTYAEEIPCNTTNGFVFTVQSHHDYTLTNCVPPLSSTAGLALTLNSSGVAATPTITMLTALTLNSSGVAATPTITMLTLMNISITVTGGSVLPLLVLTGGPPALHLENISIRVVGVRVGPFACNQSDPATAAAAGGGMIRSMVSMFSVSSNVSVTARNISLSMEDSIVDITSQYAVTSSADAANIGSMFAIRAGGVTTVSQIQVSFRNSRISLRYVAPSTTSTGLVSLVAYSYGSTISTVDVTIQNSTVAIVVNASYGMYPAAIGFQCMIVNGCILSNISVAIRDASSVALTEFVPAFTVNATGGLFPIYEVTAIVSVMLSTQVFHFYVEILQSTVTVASHCTSTKCGVATVSGLHAGIVWISGEVNFGNISSVTLKTINIASSLQSCGRTQFFTIANYDDASAITAIMENRSTVVGINGGQNYGSQTRIIALVSVYNIGTSMPHLKVSILNAQLTATMESGSCFGALVSAVFLGSLVTFTDISIANITVIADIVNGTAVLRAQSAVEITMITPITAFVIFKQKAAGLNNCDHVAVRIRDSFLASEHTTNLAVGATMVAISSLICSQCRSRTLSCTL
ncbi:membrane-associated protein, putative [Bodo saltans]|uniref:Membrane-associated protein, putative n=1 Tax=Bodo saltans TaxID=75058 RepID=A0A0S4IY26_BODSA|nr:membrane-associated protein, putative [Bodo saltans]|eukprot:CUG49762.1 membrane-associated protein, putative [Bodo saltans]